MKKAVIVLILSIIAIFCIYKNVQDKKIQAEREQARIEKQQKQIDFHNYPVKNDPKQIQKQATAKTATLSKKNNLSTVMPTVTTPTASDLAGKKIPDWVYENTSSGDRYYSLINSQSNFVFTHYANCPIGQKRKNMITKAIAMSGASNSFQNKIELMPQGSAIHGICVKSYQGNICYPKKGEERKEGTCKCAVHYLLDNCGSKFCVINPVKRRIVFVSPDEESLTKELTELKYKW